MKKCYAFRFNCKDKEDGEFFSVQDQRLTIQEAKNTYKGFLSNGYKINAYVYLPSKENPRKYEWKKIKKF